MSDLLVRLPLIIPFVLKGIATFANLSIAINPPEAPISSSSLIILEEASSTDCPKYSILVQTSLAT